MASKVLDVRCPVCNADPGKPCKRIDGSNPKLQPHSKRELLAKKT